jgi:hypothetical protein
MDSHYVRPNILKLSNISLSKGSWMPVEDRADKLFLAEISARSEMTDVIKIYDKIPRVFTTLEEWPDCTNLKCWVCNFTFDGRPKFVPTYIKDVGGRLEIGVSGNMCTFNCAARWILEKYSNNKEERWRLQDKLLIVYYLFNNCLVSSIEPSPSITEHQMYGGELEHTAFWKKLKDVELSTLRSKSNTPQSVYAHNETAVALKQSLRC